MGSAGAAHGIDCTFVGDFGGHDFIDAGNETLVEFSIGALAAHSPDRLNIDDRGLLIETGCQCDRVACGIGRPLPLSRYTIPWIP